MSIYAKIKFEMKDGYKAPVLHDSECGPFRDTVLELIKIYDEKHGIKKLSNLITLSDKELKEFGKLYADEVECEEISFEIRDPEFDCIDDKKVSVCNYYKNNEFTIEDEEIFGYECLTASAFMPSYNRYKNWALLDRNIGEDTFKENIAIFKRYIQLTLEGKMFFGIQISKIESVTLELC